MLYVNCWQLSNQLEIADETLPFYHCFVFSSSSDDDSVKSVSVTINGEESMIDFVDAEVEMVCVLLFFLALGLVEMPDKINYKYTLLSL